MKKFLTAVSLVGIICFAGYSLVSAEGKYGFGPGPGYGNSDGCGPCYNTPANEQDREKEAAFFEATKDIRKQIFVKKSELRALMSQDNPDEKKAAGLSGELFDLKSQMHEKSVETFGDNPPPFGPRYSRGWGFGGCGKGLRNL